MDDTLFIGLSKKTVSIELGKVINAYSVGPSYRLDELKVRIEYLKKDRCRIEQQIQYLQSWWEEIEQELSYFQGILEQAESMTQK